MGEFGPWQVWRNKTPDNHFWAFYYYCKRQGDIVRIKKHPDGTVSLAIRVKQSPGSERTHQLRLLE